MHPVGERPVIVDRPLRGGTASVLAAAYARKHGAVEYRTPDVPLRRQVPLQPQVPPAKPPPAKPPPPPPPKLLAVAPADVLPQPLLLAVGPPEAGDG